MILRALATLAPARYRLEFSNAFTSTHNTNSYFRKEIGKKKKISSIVCHHYLAVAPWNYDDLYFIFEKDNTKFRDIVFTRYR